MYPGAVKRVLLIAIALRKQVQETRGRYAAEIEAIHQRLPSVAAPPEGVGSL